MKKILASFLVICLLIASALTFSACNNKMDLSLWDGAENIEVGTASAERTMNQSEKLYYKLNLSSMHKYSIELIGSNIEEGLTKHVTVSLYNGNGKNIIIKDGEFKSTNQDEYYLMLERDGNKDVTSNVSVLISPIHSHTAYGLCSCGNYLGTELNANELKNVDLSMDGTVTTKLYFKLNHNNSNYYGLELTGTNLDNMVMTVYSNNASEVQVREIGGHANSFYAVGNQPYYIVLEYGESTGTVAISSINFVTVLDD